MSYLSNSETKSKKVQQHLRTGQTTCHTMSYLSNSQKQSKKVQQHLRTGQKRRKGKKGQKRYKKVKKEVKKDNIFTSDAKYIGYVCWYQ